MNFCSHCGEEVRFIIPSGDDRRRYVCSACEKIHYQNPRVVTGCLGAHEDRVLLCKRSIEPRAGFWTLPGGFLENGETMAEGALRESREEANANMELIELYGVFDVPHIHQIYVFYRARLLDLDFYPGEESLETALFTRGQVPWSDLAFPIMNQVLEHYFADLERGAFSLKTGQAQRRLDQL